MSLDKFWKKVTEMTGVQNPRARGCVLYTYATKETNVADGRKAVMKRYSMVSHGSHSHKLAKAHNDI